MLLRRIYGATIKDGFMRRNISTLSLLAVSALLILATRTDAADCCCDRCGCTESCQKVCRLVCEEKKVDVICWGCKCEEFCVPKHSKKGCKHCETVCAACDEGCACSTPHALPKRFIWREWCPTCAKIFTKKKLMKKVESVKVPSYKWVVECMCPKCEASCEMTQVDPRVELPSPPVADAKLLYAVKQ